MKKRKCIFVYYSSLNAKKRTVKHSLAGVLILVFFLLVNASSETEAKDGAALFRETLVRMRSVFDKMTDYCCHLDAYSAKGAAKLRVKYMYYFKKPGYIRMETQTGKFAGATALYKMDGKVRVKFETGLLSPFTFIFKPDSIYVVDLNKRGLPGSDFGSFIELNLRFLGSVKKITAREATVNGQDLFIFEIYSLDPGKTYGADRELIRVDRRTFLLSGFILYDSSGIVIQSGDYKNISLNNGLADSFFDDFSMKFPLEGE